MIRKQVKAGQVFGGLCSNPDERMKAVQARAVPLEV